MESYCNTSKVYLRAINKQIAKDIIVKNHYSHKWTLCQVAYGIFYKTEEPNDFFKESLEKLIATPSLLITAHKVGVSQGSSGTDVPAFVNEKRCK